VDNYGHLIYNEKDLMILNESKKSKEKREDEGKERKKLPSVMVILYII
jgi:hypothetical protein